MIFRPAWVNQEVFGVKETNVLVPLNPLLPLIYRNNGISLQVGEGKVIFVAHEPNPPCLEQMEGLACKLIEILPRTPLSGVGVNFGFIEKDPEEKLLELFNLADDVGIRTAGWTSEKKRLFRKLVNENRTLNLGLVYKNSGEIFVEANFHFNVETSEDAVVFLRNNTVKMYDSLIRLLQEVYNLEFNFGEENE